MSSRHKIQSGHRSPSQRYYQIPDKQLLPRTEYPRDRRTTNVLADKRNQKSPSFKNTYDNSSHYLKTTNQINKRISPTTLIKKSKAKLLAPINLYSTEAYYGSSKQLKFQSPTSPHSIKQMNKLKQKMKLQSQAKQAFLRVISAGRSYQHSPDLNRSKSLREFLKSQFESNFCVRYSEYFSNPQKLIQKPIPSTPTLPTLSSSSPRAFSFQMRDPVRTDNTPIEICLQEDSMMKYNQNNPIKQYELNNVINTQYNVQRKPQIIEYMTNSNKSSNQNKNNFVNNIFVQNDLLLQSHIRQSNQIIVNPIIQQQNGMQQMNYSPKISQIIYSKNSPQLQMQQVQQIQYQPQSNYNQPEYLIYQHTNNNNYNNHINNNNNNIVPNTIPNNYQTQYSTNNQIYYNTNNQQIHNNINSQSSYNTNIQSQPINNLKLNSQINNNINSSIHNQKSLNNQSSPKSILKNSFKSKNSISFIDLNSDRNKNDHQGQDQSRINDNIEPDITEKINQYLQILDMFSSNITQFDDLLNQPNSISGIVGFYLYKRLLIERIRLQRCLAGGSNFFHDLDFYEISDHQIQQFNSINEGRSIIRFIGDQNIGIQRNLKLLLDYLKKQTDRDFPKANLNFHDNFEVQLRYYLRLQVDQLKNKIDTPNLPSSKNIRLMQRLIFLYQSLFLITFFNGQFIKNYDLYQDIMDPQAYIKEYQPIFMELISKK